MSTVLAIDAAWTPTEPSGVALLSSADGRWRCLGLAPSYTQFENLANGTPVDWSRRPSGSLPDLGRLLAASHHLASGNAVRLISVDMPLSLQTIRTRRSADNAVSRAFGARGCAVHSPSDIRPGRVADKLREAAAARGFALSTTATACAHVPALIEVYPHAALLHLLPAPFRVPYKVAKTTKYWPGAPLKTRLGGILAAFTDILQALEREIDGPLLTLPDVSDVQTLASLKALEDALDALVCAWVGVRYLNGTCRAYGDETAAIWIPDHSNAHPSNSSLQRKQTGR